MARLTPLGKLVVALLAATVLYLAFSFVSPFFPSLDGVLALLPGTGGGQAKEGALEITVFVSSFDRDSVEVVETLRDLALEARYRGRFVMKIVNIHKDPGLAKEAGVTVTPAILIQNDLFVGKKDAQWFKDQIDART